MATQTGSIDLRGANSAKLYVDDEAGEIRSEVSETYATKTEVRRTDTGTGTVVSSDDAANLPPLSLAIHGKSVQDGTPSPSSPVEIQSVEGRNLQSPLFTSTRTVKGVTYTPNEDGTFTASGTATPGHSQVLSPRQYLPAGDYVISGCPQGGAGTTYYLSALCYSAQTGGTITASAYDFGSGAKFTVPSGGGYVFSYCSVYKDTAAPDAVWKPMLERGSAATAYQPYQHIKVAVSGKNLLDASIAPSSYAQVSYTNGSDGSIVLNGTKYGGGYYVVKRLGLSLEGTYTLHATQISGTATSRPTIYLLDSDENVLASATPRSGNIEKVTFTTDAVMAAQIRFGLFADNAVYTDAAYRIWLTAGSELTEYEQFVGSTVFIDLDGHALRSLPDGTEDTLEVDGEGNVTLTQRIGITTTATTDGISATVGTDAMSTTGTLADGATVIYKLASEQTISLGTIDLPSLPSPSFSMHVDALVTPTLDAEWWTQGGEEVGSVYQRTSALEQDVDGLTLELSEKVDSSEEWVSWLHAGTDATTHEPYLAMGRDSDYPSVVYSTDAARFYDGEGDAAANVVASFGAGGVVVGKDGSANTTITDSDITFHDADGNEAGKISMSSEGAVPASASHTITAGDAMQTYTLEGLTPLPDFTLGKLVVDLLYNGTLLHKYEYTSIASAAFTVSIDTYTDATFTAAQSGSTWGATLTAQHRVVGETADFTFSLKWVYRGTAPMYEFGTTENTGAYSFSAGTGLVAAGQSQAVFGTYNKVSQTDLFILGNGTSDDSRSNALKVDEQGTLETSGYFQNAGVVGLGTEARQNWLAVLGPFLHFEEVTSSTQSVGSGSVVEFTAAAPTVAGFTCRGALQAWTTGTGTTIVGMPWRTSANNTMHVKVRGNVASSVSVSMLLLYTLDIITS